MSTASPLNDSDIRELEGQLAASRAKTCAHADEADKAAKAIVSSAQTTPVAKSNKFRIPKKVHTGHTPPDPGTALPKKVERKTPPPPPSTP